MNNELVSARYMILCVVSPVEVVPKESVGAEDVVLEGAVPSLNPGEGNTLSRI